MAQLPAGFVLNPQPQAQGLPEGFTLNAPTLEQQAMQSAQAQLQKTSPGVTPEQQRGSQEAFATVATGAIAEPIAGLAGIVQAVNPFAEPGAGAEAVKATQEFLTFNPRTEEGKKNLQAVAGNDVVQAVGSALESAEKTLGDAGFDLAGPIGGAIGESIPTAIIEALGLGAPGAAGKVAGKLSAREARKAAGLAEDVDALRNPTPEEGLQAVTKTLESGTPEDVGALVQPDQNFFDAADEMGISVEPLASFGSQNPQFRAVEQGLASIPASQLDSQAKAFIGEVSQKADDLIVEYGGTLDKAELSDRFRQESLSEIDNLFVGADELYNSLGDSIPAATKVDAPNTVSFIEQKAAELGGRKELPAVMNRVLRQLETTEKVTPSGRRDVVGREIPGTRAVKQPTHERLNQTRKEIGQALSKGTGPFKDQETGILKALYKRLRTDQDAVAGVHGVSDISESANALVRQRKHLEDNMAKLLGKDLQGSVLPVVGQALKRLSKGDVEKWDSTMQKIPSSMRQEIVVTALNDIFRGNNVQGQALNPTQFTKFMDDLDRSPATKKRLYKELPAESIRALGNLRTVSKGISVALQDKIPTGRIAAFFDDNNGFLRKMMGQGINLAVMAKAGPLAASAVSEFINQSSGGAKSAAAVMASPQFQGMVRTAVREGVTEGAQITNKLKKMEKSFEKSKKFERWSKTLSDDDRAKLVSVGTVNYLLKDDEEQQ